LIGVDNKQYNEPQHVLLIGHKIWKMMR